MHSAFVAGHTYWTCRASSTRRTCGTGRTGRSGRPSRTRCASRTRRAGRTRCAGRASRTGRTGCTRRPGRTCRTSCTGRSGGTRCPSRTCCTRRASGTCWSRYTGRSRGSCGPRRARGSSGARCASRTCRPRRTAAGAGRTSRTRGTGWAGWSIHAIRTPERNLGDGQDHARRDRSRRARRRRHVVQRDVAVGRAHHNLKVIVVGQCRHVVPRHQLGGVVALDGVVGVAPRDVASVETKPDAHVLVAAAGVPQLGRELEVVDAALEHDDPARD